jgi:hypothetical protein
MTLYQRQGKACTIAGSHHHSLAVCLADDPHCCPAFCVDTALNENHHRFGPSVVYLPKHLPILAFFGELKCEHVMIVVLLWGTGTVRERILVRHSSGCLLVDHVAHQKSLRTAPVEAAGVLIAMVSVVGHASRGGRADFQLGGGGCPLNRSCLGKISRNKPSRNI